MKRVLCTLHDLILNKLQAEEKRRKGILIKAIATVKNFWKTICYGIAGLASDSVCSQKRHLAFCYLNDLYSSSTHSNQSEHYTV